MAADLIAACERVADHSCFPSACILMLAIFLISGKFNTSNFHLLFTSLIKWDLFVFQSIHLMLYVVIPTKANRQTAV